MVHFTRGSLPRDELEQLWLLWPRLVKLLDRFYIDDWAPIIAVVESWAYLGRSSSTRIPNEAYTFAKSCVKQMIRDVGMAAEARPGIMQWLNETTQRLNLDLHFSLNKDFEVLHPSPNYERNQKAQEPQEANQAEAVRALADAWGGRPPIEVIKQLVFFESEAKNSRVRWRNYTLFLCHQLAKAADSPLQWSKAALDEGITADLALPFLIETSRRDEPGWVRTAFDYLENGAMRSAAVAVALEVASPAELVDAALTQLSKFGETVESLCQLKKVPTSLVMRLLAHKDNAVAAAAVEGTWHSDPQGEIGEDYKELWQQAFCKNVRYDRDYFISQVFERNPQLACCWLSSIFLDEDPQLGRYYYSLSAAFNALDTGAKKELLKEIPASFYFRELVIQLIGEDLELYGELLKQERLQSVHLAPLEGRPEGVWLNKALIALNAGYSPKEITRATYGFFGSLEGVELLSLYWQEWAESFAMLETHEDRRIQQVGEMGRREAEAYLNKALEEEKHEAIYSRD